MNGKYKPNTLNAAFWSGAWMLGLAFLFSFFTTLLMLSAPLFMLLIYDRVLSARSQESLVALFMLVTFLLVLLALFDYSRRRIVARFGAQLQERLELKVLQAAEMRAPRRARGTGAISGTKELDRLRGFFHSSALVALMDILWAPIFLCAVFLFHPLLGWVATTGVLVLLGLAVLQPLFSGHIAKDSKAAASAMNEVAQQIREAHPTIARQGMAGSMVARWRKARSDSRDMSIILADRVTWFTTASSHLRLFVQVSILALGANLALTNNITIGGMVACFILTGRIFLPVDNFLKNLPVILMARSNWTALSDLLQQTPAIDESAAPAAGLLGGLAVRDVGIVSDFSGTTALRDVSFDVAPGEVVQITGAAASGKTLLAEALVGQMPLQSGAVTICGRNVDQFGTEHLGRVVGYLPEEIGFVSGTILENISRMGQGAAERDVVSAARRAGAHQLIFGLPMGYQTRLDRLGSGLSRGERHRIALARAVYGRPRILIIDDATETLSAKCGVFSDTDCAVVLLARSPRALVVPSRHFRLRRGRLVREDNIPPLSEATDGVLAGPVKIARG